MIHQKEVLNITDYLKENANEQIKYLVKELIETTQDVDLIYLGKFSKQVLQASGIDLEELSKYNTFDVFLGYEDYYVMRICAVDGGEDAECTSISEHHEILAEMLLPLIAIRYGEVFNK